MHLYLYKEHEKSEKGEVTHSGYRQAGAVHAGHFC